MALIVHLIKVPRYKNILTDVYETIPFEDLVLIDKYYFWTMIHAEGKTDACTMEEWCGILESKLPHKYVINYYNQFFTEKEFYKEHIGRTKGFTIFEQMGRIVKANQVFRWFLENVIDGKPDQAYHEVSKEQLANLLCACRRVRKSFSPKGHNDYYGDTFFVDEEVASNDLPLMEKQGLFFGTNQYDEMYAVNVIDTLHTIQKILNTTDFNKETIYFRATW